MNIDRELVEGSLKYMGGMTSYSEGLKEALHRDDVETHFANGGEVEYLPHGCSRWEDMMILQDVVYTLYWSESNYRIKEQSTLAERRDELLQEMDLYHGSPAYKVTKKIITFLKDLEL